MTLSKTAKKILSVVLTMALVMSMGTPVNVFADEAVSAATEVSVADMPEQEQEDTETAVQVEYVKSGEEIVGIDLNTVPVIIREAVDVSGNTVPDCINLIHDADKDGVADEGEEKLAIDGETVFAKGLDIYGTYEAYASEDIFITMDSGVVGNIYGAYQAGAKNATICINGGKADAVYGVYREESYSYKIDEKLYVSVAEQAEVSGEVAPIAGGSTEYYYGFNEIYIETPGQLMVKGEISIENNHDLDVLKLCSGTLSIPKGVSVNVKELYLAEDYTEIVLKGALKIDEAMGMMGYEKVILAGGSVSGAGAEALIMYEPIDIDSNVQNAPIDFSSFYNTYILDEEESRSYFIKTDYTASLDVDLQGYDVCYSIDDGEEALCTNGSISVTQKSGGTKLYLDYIPKQISVENNYSAQKGKVGQTYTEEKPLCDLSIYPIKNDTTEQYGGKVKYTVKKATPLPEGLSLVNGKIIGTPTKACEDGQKVTFAVTGRNGSSANLEVIFKITDSEYTKKDINELYESGVITCVDRALDLGGTSVVLQGTSATSSYYKVYLDDDQDGVPDNNVALEIDGSNQIYLWRVFGYSNTEKAYDGDIRITVKGGKLVEIYGINGDSANCENQDKKAPTVTVNGDVSIYAESLTMDSASSNIFGVKNGAAQNVTVDIKGGNFIYTDVIGVDDYSNISGNVTCNYGGDALIRSDSDTNFATWGIARDSVITGNVNATLGFGVSEDYGFARYFKAGTGYKYCTGFTGVSETAVGGDINYTINGRFTPAQMTMVSGKTVGGDVNFECITGALKCYSQIATDTYLVKGTAVTGELNIDIPEESAFGGSYWNVLTGNASVSDIYMNYPTSCTETVEIKTLLEDGSKVKNSIFVNNKGELTVRGNYTVSEDGSYTGINLLENTKLTIEEGVEVEVTGLQFKIASDSTLTNKGELAITYNNAYTDPAGIAGTLDNQGKLTTVEFVIKQSGLVVNEENASWVLAGELKNSGKIVNYGALFQTYTSNNKSHLKLGTVYMAGTMSLSEALKGYTYIDGTTPYSTFHVKANVKYPSYCVSSVTLSGERISASGLTGDTNQYIKMDMYNESPFTITLGNQKLDNVVLEGVTYGPNATAATTTDNVVWSASLRDVYEPFDVTVSYKAAGENAQISLGKTTDTVENLTVEDTFTEEDPLYDFTSISVSGDLEVEGEEVRWTLKEGSLPDGIVLKEGKLYGTLTTAAEEMSAVFTAGGLNQTTADFTLNFGAVKKAVPQWSVPTGFTGKVGQTVDKVQLPTDSRGEYKWESETELLGAVGEAVTNIIFIPNAKYSVDNYDWAQAAGDLWDQKNERIYWPAHISVGPGEPSVTAPTGLAATYGQTFADIEIPADENGTFVWDTDYHAMTDEVGEVGENICYAVYCPTDENYTEKRAVELTLTVNPATPDYKETLTEVSLFCDETLGDVLLPELDGGRYQWVSSTSTKPADQQQYSISYVPDDTTNYDWSTMDGWHKYRKAVVFKVIVKVQHAWGEGVITQEPTKEAEGKKVYTCGLCEETNTVVLDKLPSTPTGGGNNTGQDTPAGGESNIGGGSTSGGSTGGSTSGGSAADGGSGIGQSSAQPQVGYTLSDKSSKAVYKVTEVCKEVTYVKPNKKTNTKVKIPSTIKYDGVTYKVTAISNNAFKNNKKLKSVTIGTNVETIGNSAFYNCIALKSITIPKNVSKIGSKAFYGCKKLTKMTIKTSKLTEKKVGKNAFKNMGKTNYKKVKVTVPKKKLKSYKKMLQKRGLSKKAKVKK